MLTRQMYTKQIPGGRTYQGNIPTERTHYLKNIHNYFCTLYVPTRQIPISTTPPTRFQSSRFCHLRSKIRASEHIFAATHPSLQWQCFLKRDVRHGSASACLVPAKHPRRPIPLYHKLRKYLRHRRARYSDSSCSTPSISLQ